MRILSLATYVVIACIVSIYPNQTMAWHDATHMAVVKAAGLDNYVHLAVGADMAKEKAGEIEILPIFTS
jgi:L-fucose mutarotase/ribose pyranase (RbsD/FucU family)